MPQQNNDIFNPNVYLSIRLIAKLIAVFILFYINLVGVDTLIILGLLGIATLYDVFAHYVTRSSVKYAVFISAITGIMDIVLCLTIIYLSGYITTDLYIIAYFVILITSVVTRLPGTLAASIIGAIYYWILAADKLPVFNLGIREVGFIVIGLFTGLLGESAIKFMQRLKDSEEKVHHSQAATDLRQEFLMLTYHSLRTPITQFKGYVEMLNEPELDQQERIRVVQRMGVGVKRIENIVEQILTILDLESKKNTNKFERINILDMVKDIISSYTDMANQGKITIQASLSTKPIYIQVDQSKLQLALEKLIDNAIRYSPEFSTVTIQVQDRDANIEILISDQGVGISEDDLKQLFKGFHSVNVMTSNSESMGLGLYLSKLIIDSHNGRIDVSSKLGAGTKVTITLPKVNSQTFFENLSI
jgi:signal transduction histidine kinase